MGFVCLYLYAIGTFAILLGTRDADVRPQDAREWAMLLGWPVTLPVAVVLIIWKGDSL